MSKKLSGLWMTSHRILECFRLYYFSTTLKSIRLYSNVVVQRFICDPGIPGMTGAMSSYSLYKYLVTLLLAI